MSDIHCYQLSGSRSEFIRGTTTALPVLLGFMPFGLLLGTQAVQKGLSPGMLALMTGLNFGGGSEFGAIALWSATPHILTIVAVSLFINSRHLVMGAALARHMGHIPMKKALPSIFLMCDESWAISLAETNRRKNAGISPEFSLPYYLGLGVSMWLIWIMSTATGALIGPVFGDITRFGFDMAFPAVFFVLLRGMWSGVKSAVPWLVSLICAGTSYHYFPGAIYVPVGAISGILAALLLSRSAA